jgi:hypothetical protein
MAHRHILVRHEEYAARELAFVDLGCRVILLHWHSRNELSGDVDGSARMGARKLSNPAGLKSGGEVAMTQAATRYLEERRSGRHGQYPLVSRLRQSV